MTIGWATPPPPIIDYKQSQCPGIPCEPLFRLQIVTNSNCEHTHNSITGAHSGSEESVRSLTRSFLDSPHAVHAGMGDVNPPLVFCL